MIFFTVLLAFSVAATIIYGYIMLYQDRGPDGFGLKEVWSLLKIKFFRIFATVLFMLFLAFVGYMVSIVPTGLLVGMATALSGLGMVPVFVVSFLVVICYLAFLTYFVVTLSLMLPMRMREPIGLWAATGRCFRLIRQNWWATFGVFFVAYLLYLMLSIVFGMPYFILSTGAELHAADTGDGTFYQGLLIALNVIAAVGGTLFYCVPMTAIAIQYFNLVERKELKGLMQRIEALQPEPDKAPPARPPADAAPTPPPTSPPPPSGPRMPEGVS